MENHRSLKRTLLQAETQKNSEKQLFTHSDSKKKRQRNSKALPSANMRKRVSNMHESTRRFNVASRKNTKEHYHPTTLENRNPRVAIRSSVDHLIKAHPKNTSTRRSGFAA
jgi:hypothetical protein